LKLVALDYTRIIANSHLAPSLHLSSLTAPALPGLFTRLDLHLAIS
jgi:hypothetical protein